MTTSMHIRGGLILWREVLESSSRRRGPPARPADTPSRAGSARGRLPRGRRGYFARWGPTSQASSRGFGYRGYQERCITPFLLNGYPCFPIGISFAGAAPCVVPGFGPRGDFFLGDGDGSAPALSVGSALDFFSFRKLISPSWISRYPVRSGQVERTPMSRVSLSRFRLLSLFWASTSRLPPFSLLREGMALHLSVGMGSGTQGVG